MKLKEVSLPLETKSIEKLIFKAQKKNKEISSHLNPIEIPIKTQALTFSKYFFHNLDGKNCSRNYLYSNLRRIKLKKTLKFILKKAKALVVYKRLKNSLRRQKKAKKKRKNRAKKYSLIKMVNKQTPTSLNGNKKVTRNYKVTKNSVKQLRKQKWLLKKNKKRLKKVFLNLRLKHFFDTLFFNSSTPKLIVNSLKAFPNEESRPLLKKKLKTKLKRKHFFKIILKKGHFK